MRNIFAVVVVVVIVVVVVVVVVAVVAVLVQAGGISLKVLGLNSALHF